MLRKPFTLKRLFNFSGRATRREYFAILGCVFAAWMVFFLALGELSEPRPVGSPATALDTLLGLAIIGLAGLTFVVMLAALVRRVHDHDKSGVVILLNIIPLVGWIFWLISALTPGNPYENNYGPDPRDPMAAEHGPLETIFS